jgi:hypothetical protein
VGSIAVAGILKNSTHDVELGFVGAATYRIVVEGYLDPSYSDPVAGMEHTVTTRGDRKPITTLVGSVSDQAELSGVLETLYSLHLTLLSVESVGNDAP